MIVRDAMTSQVGIVNSDQTIQEAARLMAEKDVGAVPVAENDRIVGMVTDRDIAVRGVASGCSPDAKVRDVMSPDILYCFEDEDLIDVARNMADVKVRRLAVLDRDKRLVGIVSLGDVAQLEDAKTAGSAMTKISQPGGDHSQRIG